MKYLKNEFITHITYILIVLGASNERYIAQSVVCAKINMDCDKRTVAGIKM